jgi:hypothetical protein
MKKYSISLITRERQFKTTPNWMATIKKIKLKKEIIKHMEDIVDKGHIDGHKIICDFFSCPRVEGLGILLNA